MQTIITIGGLLSMALGAVYIALVAMQTNVAIAEGVAHNSALLAHVQKEVVTKDSLVWDGATSLELPRLDLIKQIIPGVYNAPQQSWTLDQEHAFLIEGSSTPIIYGHATDDVFGKLASVAVGEVLMVTTQKGEMNVFKYTHDEIVNYKNVRILTAKHENTIILMTCMNDQDRRMLYFTFVGSNERKVL